MEDATILETQLADIKAEEYRSKGYVVSRENCWMSCPASARTWSLGKVMR